MQHQLLVDAARSSSATEINAVCPYLGYTRSERKHRGRTPIGVRVVIDNFATAGTDRMVTVDTHSGASEGIFRGPFDNFTAQIALRQAMRQEVAASPFSLEDCVVIAPDPGSAKMAARHSTEFGGLEVVHMPKLRGKEDNQDIRRPKKPLTQVDGRVCVIFDDILDTGGTVTTAAEDLDDSGARAIWIAATHGILSDPATERLSQAPIGRILVTDTFPGNNQIPELKDKLRVISVAPMIATALTRIIRNESVSGLFQEENYM
jgi:ribose-phosphate pyrophosphokinase